MKNSFFLITIPLLILWSQSLYSQSIRNKEVALITYNCNIHQPILQILDGFSQFFPEVENRKCDKYVSAFKMRSWLLIEEMLREEFNVYMLPLNTFGKSFGYDQYDFPNVTINRAIRQGTSRFYLRLDLVLSQVTKPTETGFGSGIRDMRDTTEIESFDDSNDFYPEVTITVTFFTNKGIIPLQKVTGTAQATTPWSISDELLAGMVNEKDLSEEPINSFMGLTQQAMKDVFKKFPLQR